ncbi:hypothetical protein Trydic_g8705 [Trypoxylus dichotomus]
MSITKLSLTNDLMEMTTFCLYIAMIVFQIRKVIDEPRVKHEEAISSINTCIKWAEENGAELGTVVTLRLMQERTMEAKQLKCRQAKITDFLN